MRHWLGLAGINRTGVAVVGSSLDRHFHFGAEAILAAAIIIVLVLDFSWRKLTSHPAYGTGLLCLVAATLFVDAWIKRGLSDGGTILGGVVFVMAFLRLVEKVRKGRGSFTETRQESMRPVVSAFRSEAYKLPMMPVRDMVIVPGMKTPFVVGRGSSIRALEYVLASDHRVFLATQQDARIDEPKVGEISQFGCVCEVLQSVKMTDGNYKVLVEGLEMGKAIAIDGSNGFFFATVQCLNGGSEALPTTPGI